MIYFRIRFTIIDDWRSPDTIITQLDQKNLSIGDISLSRPNFKMNYCGNSLYKDAPEVYFMGKINHSSNNLTLKIISLLGRGPNIASFGLRRLTLFFLNKTDGEEEMNCAIADTPLASKGCGCPNGNYKNPLNSSECLPCHENCMDCFGPLETQCFACNIEGGYSFNGTHCINCAEGCVDCFGPEKNQCLKCGDSYWHKWDFTCPETCDSSLYAQEIVGTVKLCKPPCQPQEYMFWNRTCVGSCDAPFINRTNYFGNFCDSPCEASEFLYWNLTCLSTCSPPFVQVIEYGVKRCELPCQEGEFFYPNGTCLSTCLEPFEQGQFQDTFPVCKYPCEFENGEYLNWDNTCTDFCQPPYTVRIEGELKFCDLWESNYFRYPNNSYLLECDFPMVIRIENDLKLCEALCPSTMFVYQNLSCIEDCKFPYVTRVEEISNICILPCDTATEYYYEANSSCLSTCKPPYQIVNIEPLKICVLSLDANTNNPLSKSSSNILDAALNITQIGGKIMNVGIIIISSLSSANLGSFGLAGLLKMLPYIKYMNINYPNDLQIVLDNMNSSLISFNFGMQMPSNIEEQFQRYPLPANFEKYQLHSSFLVGYWQTMTSLLFVMVIIVILSFLILVSMQKKKLNELFRGLKLVFKWNFMLMIFSTNLDGIVLYTSFEMRTVHFNSLAAIMSFVICISMNFLLAFTIILVLYIILDIRKIKNKIFSQSNNEQVNNKWKEIQIVYKGSKETSFAQHIIVFVFLLRMCLFNLTIAYLFSYPLLQALLITSFNIFMLWYIITIKPFISRVVFSQHITDEFLILSVNICVVILAVLDATGIEASHTRAVISDVMLILNIMFNILSNIYLLIYILLGIKGAYVATKTYKSKSIVSWLLIFLAPYEVAGMDVDATEAVICQETPVSIHKLEGSVSKKEQENIIQLDHSHNREPKIFAANLRDSLSFGSYVDEQKGMLSVHHNFSVKKSRNSSTVDSLGVFDHSSNQNSRSSLSRPVIFSNSEAKSLIYDQKENNLKNINV